MISYYKKQEYLQEIGKLIHAARIATTEGVDVESILSEIQLLKIYIEDQSDITLEQKRDSKIELHSQGDPELLIKLEMEKIKQRIPEKYQTITRAREKVNDGIPDWLKFAFQEHPNWERLCLENEQELMQQDYRKLIKKIPQLFGFIPQMIKENDGDLCKEAVERNLDLLKYVPLTVVEENLEFWRPYFAVYGIDIELFQQYDQQIRERLDRKQEVEELPVQTMQEQDEDFLKRYIEEKTTKKSSRQENNAKVSQEKSKREFTPEEIKEYMNLGYIHLIPDEIKLANPQWCMQQVKSGDEFAHVPEEIKLANPQWCMSLVEQGILTLYYLPLQIQLENQEWCMQICENERSYIGFLGLAEEIKIANPEWCKKILEQKRTKCKYLLFEYSGCSKIKGSRMGGKLF